VRITAEAKAQTGQAIRDAARRLFAERGLDGTSTRDLAKASDIAAGTLFNYFPSKEALALTLVAEAIQGAGSGSQDGAAASQASNLEADLFDLLIAATHALAPMRSYLGQVLEMGLSPLSAGALSPEAQRIRMGHLEGVVAVLTRHGLSSAATPPTMHLYWALFLAILSFWAADASPTQEDTRALIDQTVRMFTGSLAGRTEGLP
jgi:AcrR family transcriptional regulator